MRGAPVSVPFGFIVFVLNICSKSISTDYTNVHEYYLETKTCPYNEVHAKYSLLIRMHKSRSLEVNWSRLWFGRRCYVCVKYALHTAGQWSHPATD